MVPYLFMTNQKKSKEVLEVGDLVVEKKQEVKRRELARSSSSVKEGEENLR